MTHFDTWRYYLLPTGPRAALAAGKLAALRGAADGEDVRGERRPLPYLRWRPDGGAALLALPPGELPATCRALAAHQVSYAQALALAATPEWTETPKEP